MAEFPPLDLHAEITTPDGATRRWHSGASDPGERPQGIQFGTARMDGFKTGGNVLHRRIDQVYEDLRLGNTLRYVGVDGDIAWEGFLSDLPRSTGTPPSWNVQAAGFMANARDAKFVMPVLDRDMSGWQDTSLARKNILSTTTPRSLNEMQWTNVPGGIANMLAPQPVSAQALAEVVYSMPPGTLAGVVEYKGSATSNPTGWTVELRATDNSDLTAGEGYTLTLDGTIHAVSLTTPRRYLALQHYANGTAATPALGSSVRFSALAVYGLTGILTHGTSDDVDAVFASDVIKWIIDTYCPLLDSSGVQATTYPIGHVSFRDPTDPYDAMLTLNSYHRWGLECWENRVVNYGPVDLDSGEYEWELRLDEPGASLDPAGESWTDVVNGVAMTFTDALTGEQKRLTPALYPELRTDDPANAVNRVGRNKPLEYQLNSPATQDMALQIGRAALGEFNAPKHKGTATQISYIRDRSGMFQPVWKVRAGDRVLISDSVDEEVHVIVETNYSHDGHSLQMSIDDTAARLEAYLARYATALQARGL